MEHRVNLGYQVLLTLSASSSDGEPVKAVLVQSVWIKLPAVLSRLAVAASSCATVLVLL